VDLPGRRRKSQGETHHGTSPIGDGKITDVRGATEGEPRDCG